MHVRIIIIKLTGMIQHSHLGAAAQRQDSYDIVQKRNQLAMCIVEITGLRTHPCWMTVLLT